MRKHLPLNLIVGLITLCTSYSAMAQTAGFTSAEYKKALWMTTRFYGAQRSGSNNWMLYNHLPSGLNPSYTGKSFMNDNDGGYDLSGGWHDCGDHVKFGQTEFYSAYMLLKGYAEFPTGYDDHYSANYAGYTSSGKYNYEENGHDPNGIPDILDEVKHATDYFIKCAKDGSTFYYQVGRGSYDHAKWVTSVKMQTLPQTEGGDSRPVYKNPSDASMPSFCGATLALMSRMYRKFDPTYADLCLVHAQYAYTYAKAHPGTVGSADGSEYGANDNWKDDYVCLLAELYWATGTAQYKTDALAYTIAASPGSGGDIYGKNYGFDYTNNGDIAIYNLALLGKSNALTVLESIINTHYFGNKQADGQFNGGNIGWGPLRYNANTAFIVALWQKLKGTQATPNKYIYDNIDYILGKNTASQSFIVGFGSKYPSHPHHRNYYLRDDNPNDAAKALMTPPAKNAQFGGMVGGTRSPGTFSDNVVNYQHTEGGIDYNACLVGSLAYIMSVLSPVDTNKFSPHKSPNLGSSQSICGVSSIVLPTGIATDGKKTFTWYKDNVVVQNASTSANTYTVTTPGTYKCVLDSAGKWNTQGSVVITGTIGTVNLGSDITLCNPASATLDIGVTGSGVTYEWKKDNVVINGATGKTYTVYSAGTYRGTAMASGCTSVYDDVVVTSSLPTAINDTACSAGEQVDLGISGAGGPYEWYDAATNGNKVATGNSYSPTISANTTYYVQDAGSVAATAGPSSTSNSLSGATNAGTVGIRFTASKAFTITQMKVLPFVYSCSGNNVSVTFTLKQGANTLGSYTSDNVVCTGVQSGAPFNTFYTLTFSTPIPITAAGSYELTPSGGNALVWFDAGANFSTMDASDVMDITDDTRDDKAASFPAVFDIKIQAGSTCARTPVQAVIDANSFQCLTTSVKTMNKAEVSLYPNPSSSSFNIQSTDATKVKVVDNLGRVMTEFNLVGQQTFGEEFSAGIYHVILYNNDGVVSTLKVLKD
ncbi:MAG: glycoside hydrolase family 9 protein [Flavobacteriales bacterium]